MGTFSTNHVWIELLSDLIADGAQQPSRDGHTFELLGYQTRIDMNAPVVTMTERKLGRRFLAAEAHWILSGDNRVSSIKPFSKAIDKFSDDGLTFNGSYGPPFVDQLPYIVRCLNDAPDTRQAVATLWRPRPGPSKDIPCTVALQWLFRDDKLHCVATMRSSDAWLGITYDWHTFSMMSAYVMLSLKAMNPWWAGCKLGTLTLTAGSQHLYSRNHDSAVDCVKSAERTPWEPYPLEFMNDPQRLMSELFGRMHGT